MRFSERRNAPGEILNLEDQHSLLRLPGFAGLDAFVRRIIRTEIGQIKTSSELIPKCGLFMGPKLNN